MSETQAKQAPAAKDLEPVSITEEHLLEGWQSSMEPMAWGEDTAIYQDLDVSDFLQSRATLKPRQKTTALRPGKAALDLATLAFEVDIDNLMSTSRAVQVVKARKCVCWVLREMGWTLTSIGLFIQRDHTSVYHALKSMRELPEDHNLRLAADSILRECRELKLNTNINVDKTASYNSLVAITRQVAITTKTKLSKNLFQYRVRNCLIVILSIHGFSPYEITHFMSVPPENVRHVIDAFERQRTDESMKIVERVLDRVKRLRESAVPA